MSASLGQATDLVIPMAFDNGIQNTEKPYAMPMHRWIAKAHGGTSQRLYALPATVRSRSRRPGARVVVVEDVTDIRCPFSCSWSCTIGAGCGSIDALFYFC